MKKNLLILILAIFLIVFFLWQGIYLPINSRLTKGELFLVERGQSLFRIAENLEKGGLVRNRFLFDFYALAKGAQRKLQAGEYSLSPAMSVVEIAKKIISGDVAKEKITIIEGWNLKDIGFYFEKRGMFRAEELYDGKKELEGYLFPDTYEIRKGASLEEIVEKMRTNFEEKTKDLEINPEIIIMASLLEKEVKTKEEKELAAGILWKRLESGMPLQVDAAMETYARLGLPAGPICNPGLESILASIYPESSEYWYYLSTPDGITIFSKTLEEHNIAKAKYLE